MPLLKIKIELVSLWSEEPKQTGIVKFQNKLLAILYQFFEKKCLHRKKINPLIPSVKYDTVADLHTWSNCSSEIINSTKFYILDTPTSLETQQLEAYK